VLLLIVSLCSCGISEKKITQTENRIKELSEKGVPDSLLSTPKILLSQVKVSSKTGTTGIIQKYADSMTTLLDSIESWYNASIKKLTPEYNSLLTALQSQKQKLTGLQLKDADSILASIESIKNKNLLLQAYEKLKQFDTLFPQLLENEKKAQTIKKEIIGVWRAENTPEDKKLKAVETRIFTFKDDGGLILDETMKGQTQERFKEDWQFISSGTWDLRGDTIEFFINKEKCVRQTYWTLMEKNGKEVWDKKEHRPYDTTITNHGKDRFMVFSDLKDSFDKKK